LFATTRPHQMDLNPTDANLAFRGAVVKSKIRLLPLAKK
jgi:hypothetical protein